MKKFSLFAIVCLMAITMSSCKKTGVNLFVGEYSFKTSGDIVITAEGGVAGMPASVTLSLDDAVGECHIRPAEEEGNKVVVAFNVIEGKVFTTTGTCDGDKIVIDEFNCNTLPFIVNTVFTGDVDIKVSATGQMYNDMIVFDVFCNGTATAASKTYKIKGKDIRMVAYRN